MRENRNSKDYEPVEISMHDHDSVSVASGVDSGGTSGKRKNVKRYSKNRKSKSSGQQAADAPYRDILADTIASSDKNKSDSY